MKPLVVSIRAEMGAKGVEKINMVLIATDTHTDTNNTNFF